jgi:hypothetical protein
MRNGDVMLNEHDDVSEHIVTHFANLFTQNSNVIIDDMVEEVIPSFITERINRILTLLPNPDEIHSAVFSLNQDSAPGTDGFGALFFQKY